MSTPEALILAALTMFALAAVWSIGVHEHRARRTSECATAAHVSRKF